MVCPSAIVSATLIQTAPAILASRLPTGHRLFSTLAHQRRQIQPLICLVQTVKMLPHHGYPIRARVVTLVPLLQQTPSSKIRRSTLAPSSDLLHLRHRKQRPIRHSPRLTLSASAFPALNTPPCAHRLTRADLTCSPMNQAATTAIWASLVINMSRHKSAPTVR